MSRDIMAIVKFLDGRLESLEATPRVGNRPEETLRQNRLLNAAGMRPEPANSVAQPNGEPFMASNAPSPDNS
jgi:hypothetical protein